MSHKELVRRMALYLKASGRSSYNDGCPTCSIVFAELRTATMETPDVIGWSTGASVLIECKISRGDFHADRKKSFRSFDEMGMGNQRYFAAPQGILNANDIPEGWGLLEVAERRILQTVKASRKKANKQAEVIMLCSAIRRLEISTAVFVRSDCDQQSEEAA